LRKDAGQNCRLRGKPGEFLGMILRCNAHTVDLGERGFRTGRQDLDQQGFTEHVPKCRPMIDSAEHNDVASELRQAGPRRLRFCFLARCFGTSHMFTKPSKPAGRGRGWSLPGLARNTGCQSSADDKMKPPKPSLAALGSVQTARERA